MNCHAIKQHGDRCISHLCTEMWFFCNVDVANMFVTDTLTQLLCWQSICTRVIWGREIYQEGGTEFCSAAMHVNAHVFVLVDHHLFYFLEIVHRICLNSYAGVQICTFNFTHFSSASLSLISKYIRSFTSLSFSCLKVKHLFQASWSHPLQGWWEELHSTQRYLAFHIHFHSLCTEAR